MLSDAFHSLVKLSHIFLLSNMQGEGGRRGRGGKRRGRRAGQGRHSGIPLRFNIGLKWNPKWLWRLSWNIYFDFFFWLLTSYHGYSFKIWKSANTPKLLKFECKEIVWNISHIRNNSSFIFLFKRPLFCMQMGWCLQQCFTDRMSAFFLNTDEIHIILHCSTVFFQFHC